MKKSNITVEDFGTEKEFWEWFDTLPLAKRFPINRCLE
jgi:hypothetical protein